MALQHVPLTTRGHTADPITHPQERRDATPKLTGRSLVLVHPPQQWLLEGFSGGLIALANHVEAELPSIPVHLMDLGLADDREANQQIRRFLKTTSDRCFVGITCTTASYQTALGVASIFRSLQPDCVVVLGGHHATAQDRIVLDPHNHHAVDFVVRGEGEIALVELLRRYPHIETVPNLTYRRGLQIVRNDAAHLLDQDDLDRIAVSFRGWGLRSAPGKFDHTTYVSARGCPLKCAFCSVANERIRNKSVEAVIRDLRVLVGEMGYQSIAIEDNFFAHTPKRTMELCSAIEDLQQEYPFRWDCQTRVESCQRTDVMEAMERAGCEAVYLGVESFDPEHLLYLNKTRSPGSYLNVALWQLIRSDSAWRFKYTAG